MSARNGARMRELVHAARRSHPGDPGHLQDGYEIIADCLETPGEASRAASEVVLSFEHEGGKAGRKPE